MTANRFCATYIAAKFGGDKLFSDKKIYIWVGACWGLGCGVLVMNNLCGCPKQFNHQFFFFGFFCGDSVAAYIAGTITKIISLGAPIFMAVLYIWMFLRLRLMHRTQVHDQKDAREDRRAKSDRRLLVQACILCTVLLLENVSFWVFPRVIQGPWASITTGWMVIINSSINPVVYWVFNSKIRDETLSLVYGVMGKKHVANAATSVGPSRLSGIPSRAGASAATENQN